MEKTTCEIDVNEYIHIPVPYIYIHIGRDPGHVVCEFQVIAHGTMSGPVYNIDQSSVILLVILLWIQSSWDQCV